MISRRSFLSAILASAVAPRVVPGSPYCDRPSLLRSLRPGVFQHYTVWDSVAVVPGVAVSEKLFGAPWPHEFMINAIGLNFPGEADTSQWCRGLGLNLRIKSAGSVLLDAPLWVFGAGYGMGWLAVPVILAGPDVELLMHSAGRPIEGEPFTFSVIFHGLVRL